MKPYSQLSKEELTALKKELEKQFEDVKGKGLKLDMSRGKPAKAQLDLSNGMMPGRMHRSQTRSPAFLRKSCARWRL